MATAQDNLWPRCLWCHSPFVPRVTGGKPQLYCTPDCCRERWRACRIYGEMELEAGRVSTEVLKQLLHEKERRGRRKPMSGGHPETRLAARGKPPSV